MSQSVRLYGVADINLEEIGHPLPGSPRRALVIVAGMHGIGDFTKAELLIGVDARGVFNASRHRPISFSPAH